MPWNSPSCVPRNVRVSDGSAQAWNMKLISQSDLGGFGNGGEGLALQATADGRRIMYVAHESGP